MEISSQSGASGTLPPDSRAAFWQALNGHPPEPGRASLSAAPVLGDTVTLHAGLDLQFLRLSADLPDLEQTVVPLPVTGRGADLAVLPQLGANVPPSAAPDPQVGPGTVPAVDSAAEPSGSTIHPAAPLDSFSPGKSNSAASHYSLARKAAGSADIAPLLAHLRRAIAADPARAAQAIFDPAFAAIRGHVASLVRRLLSSARAEASVRIVSAAVALEAVESSEGPNRTLELRALLQGAEILFQRHSLGGYLSAGATAAIVRRLLAQPRSETAAPPRPTMVPLLPGRWSEPGLANYQQARDHAGSGDCAEALILLEQAIAGERRFAAEAVRDPAFAPIREVVAMTVRRLTLAARSEAESALTSAGEAFAQAAAEPGSGDVPGARAVLDAAEALFQSHTYAGYVEAMIAAGVARRLAAPPKPSAPATGLLSLSRPGLPALAAAAARRIARESTSLWRRLPLLAAMLIWFVAGALLGWIAPPAWRNWIFPVWAMGLLGFVLTGFVRSLSAAQRRNR